MLELDEETILKELEADEDDPIKSHYVDCPEDKESTAAWLAEALMFGLTVRAICGYEWVPSRDPLKHPICQDCIEEAGRRLR